ncbi:class I SAM-dependent methyltransferase [uncultured Desulfobacter sp.]|uniref:class I SAM-dependent methyltransferase n=1 Tax=uncultured Desulfobacter sp. TaxID=240139 RepID=UPI002AAB32F7|nr:class I SAM-dependent methyltransferase [uncultured Desulfobacter sp.]
MMNENYEIAAMEVIGHPDNLRKVVEVWSFIELDKPLANRRQRMLETIKNEDRFWNIHAALSYATWKINPTSYLEIGTRTGGSMVQALQSPNLKSAVSVDLWNGEYAGMTNTLNYSKKQISGYLERQKKNCEYIPIQGSSHKILPQLIDQQKKFNLICVDGDHTEGGAWLDLVNAERLLSKKGVIIFDDLIHPSCPYMIKITKKFMDTYPEFNMISNTKQDNGCAIFLKGIDPSDFLQPPKQTKIAEELDAKFDLTEIGGEFRSAIRRVFKKYCPRKIVESGTYHGTGSTKTICEAIRDSGITEIKFYTIEVNPECYQKALVNLKKNRLETFVTPVLGLSVPTSYLPNLEQINFSTIEEISSRDIFVDHKEIYRVANYYNETNFDGVEDDMIGKILSEFDGKPDFVLLDSAGHLGFIEFEYVLSMIRKPCLIALDDIFHVKHYKSYALIQKSPRFKMIKCSQDKFGFCIAHYNPSDSN